MNYLEKIVTGIREIKSSWESAFLKNIPLDGAGNVVKEPYKNSEIAYICISTTARAIAQVPLRVYEAEGSGTKEKAKNFMDAKLLSFQSNAIADKQLERMIKGGELKPVPPNNKYQMLLEKPNPYMDGFLFKEAMITNIMLDGNVWDLYEPTITNPSSIWVARKNHMEAKINKSTGRIEYWIYHAGIGKALEIEHDELTQVKLYNPNDPVYGQAPLEVGGIALKSDYKASVYNERFFDNASVPSGVLSTDRNLSDKIFMRVKDQFQQRHKGYENAGKIAVLEAGLTYDRTALTQEEMQFLDGRKYNREIVMQILGMKNVVISVTDNVNHATAKEQRKEWWQDTNLPLMRLIASGLNGSLFLKTPYIALWDTANVEALQEDYNDKIKSAKDLFYMGVSFNECNERLQLGFKNTPERDIGYVPVNIMPVGDTGDEDLEDLPEPDLDEDKGEDVRLLSYERSQITKQAEWEIRAEVAWKAVNRKLIPLEKQFTSKTKKLFFEIRKKILKQLLGKSVKQLTPEELIRWIDDYNQNAEIALLERYSTPLITQSVVVGGTSVISDLGLGGSFNLTDPAVTDYLNTKQFKIKSISHTAFEKVRSSIVKGVENGEDLNKIANRIKTATNVNINRAKTIARTEIVGASNFGRNTQMRKTGFKEKQWFTAQDEKVRGNKPKDKCNHVVMNGQKTAMNDIWDTPCGGLRYPGDYSGSPANVINCRCIEVVVPKSYNPDEDQTNLQ